MIIQFKDRAIHFRDTGEGSVVVLIHGFMESQKIWSDFSIRLSKSFRVITIDLPGHGESECIDNIHTMEMMAEAVNNVLEHLQVDQCVMIGHSMGGYVTLAFAEKYGAKLQGYGLFHSLAAGDSDEAKVNRERTVRILKSDRPDFISSFFPELFAPGNVKLFEKQIDRLKEQAGATPVEGSVAAMEGMKFRPSRLKVLNDLKVPVLFIIGRQDPRIPVENVLAETFLPDVCEIHMFEHVGHMGFIEAEEETYKAIFYFLKKIFPQDNFH